MGRQGNAGDNRKGLGMIEYTDEQHDSLIRGHRKQLADAQATVEALQRERDAAKASRDMWKREAYLIGDALRPLCGLSEYEFGWKPAVKTIADKLAALDAEREKAKNDATAYRKLSEQWNATDLELSQLKALVRAFFTSEDKWVVAYRELERLGHTLDATTPENGVDSAGRSARKDENRDAVWGKIKN